MIIERLENGSQITFTSISGELKTGVVTGSRVKYGGELIYYVDLDEPVKYRWRVKPITRYIVSHKEIVESAKF